MPQTFQTLRQDAIEIRRRFLRMHFDAQSGHIGTGLSAIDVLVYVYGAWLQDGDRFILSKGHGASSLYATLRHYGLLTETEIQTYYKEGTLLPAHPAARAFTSISAATGSLGHGLSICTGVAYAEKRLRRSTRRISCLLSDGECNEGSVWEAALFASHHGLDNLSVIIDANGLQGFGRTKDVLQLEPLAKKWEAFGFSTHEIDGHSFDPLHEALTAQAGGKPRCVIARTIKGKGVSFLEDKLESHYLPVDKAQFDLAMQELDQAEQALRAQR